MYTSCVNLWVFVGVYVRAPSSRDRRALLIATKPDKVQHEIQLGSSLKRVCTPTPVASPPPYTTFP